MIIYIVATIVSIFLLGILFFALKSTVNRIDYNTKKFFIDKLQDYDYLIEEKQKVLDELNEKIDIQKKQIINDSKEDKKEIKKQYIGDFEPTKVGKYEDEDVFKKYKQIKNNFNINYEKLIIEFLNKKVNDKTKNFHNNLLIIRKKVTNEFIYKNSNKKSSIQKNLFLNLLSENERQYILNKFNLNNFNIKKFSFKLDSLIRKSDPYVYIYVGDKRKNYTKLSDSIRMVYEESINEGIKIIYRGILYDFSL